MRDRLLQRQGKYLDLDFVLPARAIETAQAIAHKYKAGFVVLDAERQIARVVFKNGTADFAQQMGASLEADLGRRDFCMNAIALECHQLSTMIGAEFEKANLIDPFLIDPFNGVGDLQAKVIRMVAPENLAEDPLRILRGYRQAAQLGFAIENLTHQVCIKLAPKLISVASERVWTELAYILALAHGSQWLTQAISDRILEDWLPRGCLDLERFAKVEETITALLERYPNLELFFSKILAGDRHALIIVKLAALSNSATALQALGLSRSEQRWIVGILRYLPQFINLLDSDSARDKYRFFQSTLEFFPAIATLAVASGQDLAKVTPWLEHWLNPHDPIAYPIALITGDDLRYELGIAPSPKIGELLESVKIAQVQGQISSRDAAIALVQSLLEQSEG